MVLTAAADRGSYESNRDVESVIDTVIDMLVVAHSSIVGFSGSDFQNIAQLYCSDWPFIEMEKPVQEIFFPAIGDLTRLIQTGGMSMGECVGQCLALHGQGRTADAMLLEKAAIEIAEAKNMRDEKLFSLHHNLAAHLLMDGHPYEASLYGEKAKALIPDSNEVKLLFDAIKKAMGHAN
jgi:hypothetical protein